MPLIAPERPSGAAFRLATLEFAAKTCVASARGISARGKAPEGVDPSARLGAGMCSGRAPCRPAAIHGPHVHRQRRPQPYPAPRALWSSRGVGAPRRIPAFLVESRAPAAVRRRDRVFRRALVGADVFAGLLVVGLASGSSGRRGPERRRSPCCRSSSSSTPTSGLYRRDELLLRKSTLDEAPAVFQAATLTTVVAFLLESALLRHADGRTSLRGHLARACRSSRSRAAWLPAAIARTRPRRSAACWSAMRRSPTGSSPSCGASPNVKATFVGRIPLDASPGSTTARVLGHARRAHARRRRARRAPRDRRRRRGSAPARARRDPAREGAGHPRQRAAADVRGRRLVGGVRLPRRARRSSACAASGSRAHRAASSAPSTSSARRSASCCSRRSWWRSPWWSSSPPRGPVLFRQTRVGRDGHTFEMLKYRSMHDGADARKAELLGRNEADGLFKIADDPRITPRRALPAQDVARRAAAALQRPARPDEPRRSAPARRRRGPAHRGLVPATPAPDPRDDRRLAGLRRRPHPAARDGHDRLPLRLELVAVGGHQDPAAHRFRAWSAGAASDSRRGR